MPNRLQVFFVALSLLFLRIQISHGQIASANQSILKKHVYYLASDKLRGRAPGTKGETLAAEYIKKHFVKAKLKGGDGGKWFQTFSYTQLAHPHATAEESKKRNGMNVMAWLDNGALETIVIGAHYDHLGDDGENSSLEKEPQGKIHYGADDNASGVASLLELSRMLAGNKVKEPTNFLFIAFSAEEAGLIGSKYFTEHSNIPLHQVKAMLNMDMVGRLVDSSRRLIVAGYGTAPQWHTLLTNNNKYRFRLVFDSAGLGPSDHASFYKKDIPVLHFFTGTHSDYHKSTDTPDKINYPGMADVTNFIYDVTMQLAATPITFTPTKTKQQGSVSAFKVTLGIMPDYAFDGTGVKIDGVSDGRPAQLAGIKAGDVLLKLGEYECKNVYDYMAALAKFQKGQTVEALLLRAGTEVKTYVTF
jgi:hypothetical protein